ncbi:MAG TPA: geranylgeranyl reductase family protein [Casimicrobiaceae bacterium]
MRQISTEILVIGAGPAGAAAAATLACRGREVVLVDRSEFPRDKVCGDALIPDALHALEALGLQSRVLAESRQVPAIRVYAPNGVHVSVDVDAQCVPRRRFDDIVREAAVASGAAFLAPYELSGALDDSGRVGGARFADRRTGDALTVSAAFTVLATGAAAKPLETFAVCERRSPSAVAARIYVRVPRELSEVTRHCSISYDRHICPGYGWIFPGPSHVFNVGVAYFTDSRRPPPTANLRELLTRFLTTFAPARELMAVSQPLTDVRGAPLRTALAGAALSRPGLLVIGEACGLTYSFTGEGIGKAIESGIIAGELLAGGSARSRQGVAGEYASAIRARFAPRFRAYKLAQEWLAHPALHDFLAWRGNAGTYVAEQMRELLLESGDPRALFSVPGLLKALVR